MPFSEDRTSDLPADATSAVHSLPDTLTLTGLTALTDRSPTIEIHSIDMGFYLVRIHLDDQMALLVDDAGDPWRFTGTAWISRTLAPLGFTHATLTWAEVTDEMVGQTTSPAPLAEVIAHGTRIALSTHH
ncbi:DUF6482 family protein [Halomonas denitrificans]|uniref:DUF6482 family protein n=1 Tax=Halomonas TaxID=2745 RepID=UPI001C98BEA6|nr:MULTISPECIES: DUF6482 family protein [Halomonas]MED5294534.1 DUF6482 family protein [Pseudomonadota bacterium]MBY5929313.1 hypothetical protein [Halomonas sp. DP8Y7-3]MBY5986165.1 hypothetical protein [Halomonas sp. DP5Y7-2]MBY6208334.1 hypothetical protein [Halomonas sp. DP3Y7-2]MBY6229143.1 hypothetical protein [Halomonas sp. DP3Y7-1]